MKCKLFFLTLISACVLIADEIPAQRPQAGVDDTLIGLAPIAFFILLIYFLIVRPQNTRRKKHQEMITSLKKGDKIITTGGLIAEVVKPEDDFFSVRLNDDTIVKLSREFVAYKIDDTQQNN
ncbi:preprotein translocase subunit YajC [Helicobacter sp. 23-1048]